MQRHPVSQQCPFCLVDVVPDWEHVVWGSSFFTRSRLPETHDVLQRRLGWSCFNNALAVLQRMAAVREVCHDYCYSHGRSGVWLFLLATRPSMRMVKFHWLCASCMVELMAVCRLYSFLHATHLSFFNSCISLQPALHFGILFGGRCYFTWGSWLLIKLTRTGWQIEWQNKCYELRRRRPPWSFRSFLASFLMDLRPHYVYVKRALNIPSLTMAMMAPPRLSYDSEPCFLDAGQFLSFQGGSGEPGERGGEPRFPWSTSRTETSAKRRLDHGPLGPLGSGNFSQVSHLEWHSHQIRSLRRTHLACQALPEFEHACCKIGRAAATRGRWLLLFSDRSHVRKLCQIKCWIECQVDCVRKMADGMPDKISKQHK